MNPIIQIFVWFTLLAFVLYALNIYNLFLLPRLLYLIAGLMLIRTYNLAIKPVNAVIFFSRRAWMWIGDHVWKFRFGSVCAFCERRPVGQWVGPQNKPLCDPCYEALCN